MPSTSTDRITGLSTSVAVKAPVAAVSDANLTLYGEQTVGGVAVLAGDRVLVKDQTDATENGIWVASQTDWARAEDFDGSRDVVKGTLIVTSASEPVFYQVSSANPITIGTTSLTIALTTGAAGDTGSDGLSVAELVIYIRSATMPATPSGGSYDFDTQTLTAPASWTSAIPAGNQPVYSSRSVASITGVSGVDATLTWTAPVRTLSDGQSLNIVFKRSASQPSTPADSAGVPTGWYDTVAEVPGSSDPMWSCVGTRPNADEDWTWEDPVQIEGEPGADAVFYYIKPIDGTAIKNGTGTLTVEAHQLSGGTDTLLSSGTIKLYVGSTEVTVANGYAAGSDGYTGVFDSGDIAGSVTVIIKDGPAGAVLDTITLVDIADGTSGSGTNSVYGYIETNAPIAWTRDADGSTWTPATSTIQVDCTFLQAASEIARVAWVVTRDASGHLTGAAGTHTGGDLNSGRVTVSEINEGTQVFTVKFAYAYTGDESAVAETFYTSMAGADGSDGPRGPGTFEVAVGSSGTGYSISIDDASLWNGGSLTDALAVEAAAFVIAASSNGYLETRDAVTVYESGVQSATRVYTGARTNAYVGMLAANWSSKVAQTIDGSLIVNGTISASKVSVSTLSSLAADLGTVSAGNLTLNATGYLRSGQTDYATGTGFFLGRSGGATKFSIGNTSDYIKWDGSTLSIGGDVIVAGNLAADAVTTSNIIDGSIGISDSLSGSGSVNYASYAALSDSAAITAVSGKGVLVVGALTVDSGQGLTDSAVTVYYRVMRGATPIYTASSYWPRTDESAGIDPQGPKTFPLIVVDSPGAGSVTYTIQAYKTNNSLTVTESHNLYVQQLKR